MAELFDNVFNKAGIYDILFFNVKPVLIYSTLNDLKKNNLQLFERWLYLEQTKYKPFTQSTEETQKIYEQNAVYYPEYTKIIAITYATVYAENGVLKRYMKKIVNDDEFIVLSTFMDELYRLSSDGVKSTPQHFPILCGHNILSHDIPLLVKRFILFKDKFLTNKQIPYILKHSLNLKPWESGVIDTVNVWKFNGYDKISLMMISDFLGLKKTVDLLPLDEMSKQYWEMMNDKPDEALEFVSLQSATQTNLVIQLMNELRQL